MKYFSLLFVTLFACAACSQGSVSAANEPVTNDKVEKALKPEQQLKSVYTQIDQLNIDLSCESSAQCAAMGVGSAACGGPSSYVLHSTNADQAAIEKLTALAKRSSLIEKKLNSKSGLAGICQYNSPPPMACVENKCVVSTQGITE